MKNLLSINPEVGKMRVKALWFDSAKTQELYMLLINLGVEIDAFCMEEVNFETFMGKRALSVFELVEEREYALILHADSYEKVLEKYADCGLDKEKVFVWMDPKREVIYV